MSRSIWKVPFSRSMLKENGKAKSKQVRIWSRASTILPNHLERQIYVHNGKNWIRVATTERMIGHKFGEFALTRKKTSHKLKSVQRNSRSK